MGATRRWFSRWQEVIRTQLTQGLGAHELSLALSVGGACAFCPLLGLATPLCVLSGWALRLNQPVIQAVNVLTAPLYPLVVFAFFRLGGRFLHFPPHPSATARVAQFALTAVLGWLLSIVAATPVIYLLSRLVLGARRRPITAGAGSG